MFWKWCPFRYDSQIVTLSKDTDAVLTSMCDKNTVYDVVVKDADDKETGSLAHFILTTSKVRGGSVFRTVATAGKYGETVTIHSNADSAPILKYHSPPSGDDTPKEQRFRVVFKTL